jgi:hypothetical protein
MATKLTFTRPKSLAGVPDNQLHERDLKRAAELFKRGDPVPETIWCTANSILAERARLMSFDSQRPYQECMKEVLKRAPHLRLGTTAWMPDRYFGAIEFIEEGSTDASND